MALYAGRCYELNVWVRPRLRRVVLDSSLSQRVWHQGGCIYLFQMLQNVIAVGGGQMKDVMGGKWGGGGMSVPDLIVKFTKVSLVVFFNEKNPTHRETSQLTFTFTIKRSLT